MESCGCRQSFEAKTGGFVNRWNEEFTAKQRFYPNYGYKGEALEEKMSEQEIGEYLELLKRVLVDIRHMARINAPYEKIEALADSVHNLPSLLKQRDPQAKIYVLPRLQRYYWKYGINYFLYLPEEVNKP